MELLKRLSEAIGPSGFEDEVRELVEEIVTPLCDEVRTDALGNLICTRRGRRPDTILLDAHTDEVGFLVSYIDDAGFLRLHPLGGWDDRILLAHAVTIVGRDGRRVRGVVGTSPPHILSDEDRRKPVRLDDLFVDVGATSTADVDALGIEIGSPAVPAYPFEELGEDLVMGKAFDDRAGCAVAIETLRALRGEELDLTLVVAFVTSEEVGLRGARTAAHQVGAAVAIALEGTTATDVPGVPPTKRLAVLGRGPAVTVADRSLIASRKVVALLEETGTKEGIPFQRKLPGGGGTDAAAIQTTGAGALCGVVSVPCRYIHTPLSLLRPSDLDATVRLTTAFVRASGALVP
jgi:putative aminopeptidase FrvX